MKKTFNRILCVCLLLAMLLSAMPMLASHSHAAGALGTVPGSNNLVLFNSGRTGSASNSSNYSTTTLTNGNNDIYIDYGKSVLCGLNFTINEPVTEQAVLSVNAYDIDEGPTSYSNGPERVRIYLQDETAGTEVLLTEYLHGMNSQWNTTTVRIDPSCFTVGHTYRFRFHESIYGWHCWIRNIHIELTTEGQPAIPDQILEHQFTADISASGLVTTSLYLKTNQEATYTLEYAANCGNNQYGSALNQTVTATPSGVTKAVSFQLENGAPEGNYQVDVILKDADGNVKATYTVTTSGPDNSTVNYDANGGSNNLPMDYNVYHSGDQVTVLFNYLPSKYGYIFQGWARNASATSPEFTAAGSKTFTIGSNDVTLYAVWAPEHTVCVPGDWITDKNPTCTEPGSKHKECTECGDKLQEEMIPALGHNYVYTKTVEPTCTAEGYDLYTCDRSGCGSTKKQMLDKVPHNYGSDNVCDDCGHTVPVVHTHDYTATVVPPTCTSVGYTAYTCSCGDSYRADYIENLPHAWSVTVTKEKNCTADGMKTHTCDNCSAYFTEIIPAGHNWQETVTVPATCTTDGEISRTCADCGAKDSQIIPAGHSWNSGTQTKAPTCTEEGLMHNSCTVCGHEETAPIAPLGHQYKDGVCVRCGALFIDNVTSDTQHPEYGMYFSVDDVKSGYGPDLINEYGVLLDYNPDAQLKKVAVYLTQDGTMWRRCIACVGENITYATYVPYLSYDEDIKYTGLNSAWINTFRLSKNSQGIWCYSDYATIGVNLEDANGNLLLSLYDIGQAGAKTRIFDDLDEMKAWLLEDSECISHTESDWIVDLQPTVDAEGRKHTECTACGKELQSQSIAKLMLLSVDKVEATADSTVKVRINVANNTGVLGAQLTLNYDSALTLVEAKSAEAWANLDFTAPGVMSAPCNFLWDGVDFAATADGAVLELTFRVSEEAQVGDCYAISVSYDRGDIVDENLLPITPETAAGSVTVVKPVMTGDLSGDEEIGINDVIMLRRIITGGYDNQNANTAAADINGDGELTITDVILLRRYIAGGYGVEL